MNAVERTDVDGDIYFGEVSTYDSEIFCGKGILAGVTAANPYIAVGWFRNRLLSGKGRCIIEASLAIYEGEFYNFKYHGNGKMTESDGDIYEGEYRNNKRHGFGNMKYGNGQIYRGQWKDNQKDGSGIQEYVLEGYTREGTWKQNAPDGEQMVTFKNGETRLQMWVNKEMVGDEVLRQAD